MPTEADRVDALALAQTIAPDETIDASELVVLAPATTQGDATAAAAPSRGEAFNGELQRVVASTPLIFETDQTELTELHTRILNSVASIMFAYPEFSTKVVGFADGTGSDARNDEISRRRAENVKAYLVGLGVPEATLVVDGMGEQLATGSAQLASLERRVEFEVIIPPGGDVATGADAPPVRIAVVAPSASNDLAFTQSMVDAIAALDASRGNVEVAITDATFVPDEAAQAIRGYAAEGYDLVIAHGSQYGPLLVDIATEFPETAFAWGTGGDTFGLPNVYAYDAAAEQGGYVLGSMAALLTTSGHVGVVGPIEVGDAKLYVDGFRTGTLAAKPDANVHVAYTGSFSDLTLAAETAESHVADGADIMTGSAQMVVGAISVARGEQHALVRNPGEPDVTRPRPRRRVAGLPLGGDSRADRRRRRRRRARRSDVHGDAGQRWPGDRVQPRLLAADERSGEGRRDDRRDRHRGAHRSPLT